MSIYGSFLFLIVLKHIQYYLFSNKDDLTVSQVILYEQHGSEWVKYILMKGWY